ncbi:hypothetical protein M8818_007733 [Zalaria obscura]|uniref:Uncharacterized protein n=1 Tax=Zalaria obscura TaxID=2024903 RepID=A0ACC3S666_9PEZI
MKVVAESILEVFDTWTLSGRRCSRASTPRLPGPGSVDCLECLRRAARVGCLRAHCSAKDKCLVDGAVLGLSSIDRRDSTVDVEFVVYKLPHLVEVPLGIYGPPAEGPLRRRTSGHVCGGDTEWGVHECYSGKRCSSPLANVTSSYDHRDAILQAATVDANPEHPRAACS